MPWILFALLAPALWAFTNLIDDDLIRTRIKDPVTLMVITGLFAGIPALALLFTGHLSMPSETVLLFACLAGAANLLSYLPYYYALRETSAANVILMWNLIPAFVTGLAWVFLDEALAPAQYAAIALLVMSSLLAAYRKAGTQTVGRWAYPLMAGSSVLVAVQVLATKRVFHEVDFATGFGWISAATFAVALLFLLRTKTRSALRLARTLQTEERVVVGELLDVGAGAAKTFAISLGSVSVVQALEGTQPLFVVLFGALFFHHAQKITRADAARVLIATALAVTGFLLLT